MITTNQFCKSFITEQNPANPQSVHPQANQHHHHHHQRHRFHELPHAAVPSLYPVNQKPPQMPVFPKPVEVIKTLRSMFEDDDEAGATDQSQSQTQPQSSFREQQPTSRAYYPPNPPQYQSPQYPPQYPPPYAAPQYEPKYDAPSNSEPKYESKPNYEPKSNYEQPAPVAPKYEPAKYAPVPCGSNLLISFQPHVQRVPCYPPSSYSAPLPYSNSYKSPNPPAYYPIAVPKPPAAVYLQPGPPYPEPTLSSTFNGRSQVQTGNTEKTSKAGQKDSEPESSNIAGQTNESNNNVENVVGAVQIYAKTEPTIEPTTTEPTTTTSTTVATTTTTTTLPTPIPLKPSIGAQVLTLHGKLNNQEENIRKFRADAGKKLREAIERSNAREAVDEFDSMQNLLDQTKHCSKRQCSQNRDLVQNTIE